MRPITKGGRYIWVENISPASIKPGDVVLYNVSGKNFLHRVIKIEQNPPVKLGGFRYTLSDDAGVVGTHTVSADSIIGRQITFFNGIAGLIFNKLVRLLRPLTLTLSHKGRGNTMVAKTLWLIFSFLPFYLSTLLPFYPSTLHAATRIKTVEYNFGGYYSATNLASGVNWVPPYITVNLPESGVAIKSAYVEFEGLAVANASVTGLDIYFNIGTSTSMAAIDNITAQYTYRSGESLRVYARADVTPRLTAWNNQPCSALVVMSGVSVTSNMHSLKLYITYEYEDTSATQIKTIKYPLESNEATAPAGTYYFPYNAYVPESAFAGYVLRQAWFEIRGYRSAGGATTSGNIKAKIYGQSDGAATMQFDGSLRDSYDFRYLTDTGTLVGFSVNTDQQLQIDTAGNATIAGLGGELVLTYEYSNSASTKTKTLDFFYGQSVTAGATSYWSNDFVIHGSGISIKKQYFSIDVSHVSTTQETIKSTGSFNGQAFLERNFSDQTQALKISGYRLFHDLSDVSGAWNVWQSSATSGVYLVVTPQTINFGGYGVRLIVTYAYNSEPAFTEFYSCLTGQSANGNASPNAQTFNVWFPDPATPVGKKDNLNSFIELNKVGNSGNSNMKTKIDVSGTDLITVETRHPAEANYQVALYKVNQLTVSSNQVTANYNQVTSDDVAVTAGGYTGACRLNYTYWPVPDQPPAAALSQYKSDGTTFITTGTWTNQDNVTLKFSMTSPPLGDLLFPVVEVKQVGTDFNELNLTTGTALVYNGTTLTGQVNVTGLTTGTTYHWRASIVGNGGR
ncbi:MAG: hypothetical protein AB1633_07790, partial [Elusimicrobiota bacterium]